MSTVGVMVWALVALATAPRAWGWDDWTDRPCFDPFSLLLAILWPLMVPAAAASLAISAAAGLVAGLIWPDQPVRVRRARARGRLMTWG